MRFLLHFGLSFSANPGIKEFWTGKVLIIYEIVLIIYDSFAVARVARNSLGEIPAFFLNIKLK